MRIFRLFLIFVAAIVFYTDFVLAQGTKSRKSGKPAARKAPASSSTAPARGGGGLAGGKFQATKPMEVRDRLAVCR